MTTLLAGLEAGGTKFLCALGTEDGEILAQARIPTASPAETTEKAIRFFQEQRATFGEAAALGIAAFGPLELNPRSPFYGHITSTPKPGWAGTDLLGSMAQAMNIPVTIDTDVNAAALAEWRWGSAKGLDSVVYMTIGTGVGGGGLLHGRPIHGLVHPEMGHILVPHDRGMDPFPGCCPFHGDCLEGLASGLAIEKRWQTRAESLPQEHPAWPLEAHYLALGLTTVVCTLSPQRIILGGGVMRQSHLFPLIRAEVASLLNGYVQAEAILAGADEYIVGPTLGDQAGIKGALALACSVPQGHAAPSDRRGRDTAPPSPGTARFGRH
jgi:fructokinase